MGYKPLGIEWPLWCWLAGGFIAGYVIVEVLAFAVTHVRALAGYKPLGHSLDDDEGATTLNPLRTRSCAKDR